jgi:membrane protein
MFVALQGAMNRIWEIEVTAVDIRQIIRSRLLGFLAVVFIASLLLALTLLTAMIALYRHYLDRYVPGTSYLWPYLEPAISFVVLLILFAVLFKFLPDAIIQWRDVWIGAFVTSALFALGKYGIAYYLSRSGVQSAYGAAGAIFVVLAWIYYSTLIFLLGGEFTQAYADLKGRTVMPKRHARHRPHRLSHSSPERGEGDSQP